MTRKIQLSCERGESIVGFLVSLGLSSVVFAAVSSSFIQSTRMSADQRMLVQVQEDAKAIADLLAFEFRLMGAGMPLGQGNFAIEDAALGDVPLPILLDASATQATLRFNELGNYAVLTADFDPSMTSTISVSDATIFSDGDAVYISDMLSGGTAGLQGIVASVGGNTITIEAGPTYTAATVFQMGNTIEPVSEVTFANGAGWDGVTRDAGLGAVTLAPNSQVTFEFVDDTGTALVLPLTATVVADDLVGMQAVVTVRSNRQLSTGKYYTAQATHSILFRNLLLSR